MDGPDPVANDPPTSTPRYDECVGRRLVGVPEQGDPTYGGIVVSTPLLLTTLPNPRFSTLLADLSGDVPLLLGKTR